MGKDYRYRKYTKKHLRHSRYHHYKPKRKFSFLKILIIGVIIFLIFNYGGDILDYIQNGNIGEIIIGNPEKYMTEPKTINLWGIGNWIVYAGVHDYLSEQDRSMSYYYTSPTDRDFILRDLDDSVQKVYLDPLVDKIKNKSDDSNEQARIAIRLVQAIPYDWSAFETNNVEGRYPYEVLYDMEGVCMEKADLMAYLLRGLGFGIAIFEYDLESHRAVGIKCNNGNYGTDYCFVEATDFYPIGQIPSDYVGEADIKNALPKVIVISDGIIYS